MFNVLCMKAAAAYTLYLCNVYINEDIISMNTVEIQGKHLCSPLRKVKFETHFIMFMISRNTFRQ